MRLRFTLLISLLAAAPLLGEVQPQGDDTILETDDGAAINPDAPDTPDAAPQQPAPAEPAKPAGDPPHTAAATEAAEEAPAPPPPQATADTEQPAPPVADETAPQEAAAPAPAPAAATAGSTNAGFIPEGDDHVVSQSGFFSVSGGDSLRMGAIATHADDVYRRLLHLLDLKENHRYTVSIRLIGRASDAPQPRPIRTRIRIIGNQPNFQIRIYPGGGIDISKLDSAIITMALYENALRELEPDAYPDTVNLPDWLVTGIIQTMQWRNGQINRELYRNLFQRAEMLPPETLISVDNPDELDAASRQVYNLSCGVMMMSLLSREGGREQLKTLLAEAATADGSPKEILASHFHELGADKDLLNKWWALQLAELSLPRAEEALTPLESERQLSEALTLIWFDPETETPRPLQLDNVYELLEHENWRDLVQPSIERLVRLSAFCFPAYRPIITEYCRVIADLMNGATPDEVQSSLGPLQELRHAYLAAAIRGRDYLDWYEITHLGQQNRRSFDSYLEAMQMLRREVPGPDTPLSRYLDDIEALYKQGADAPLPDNLLLEIPARHGKKKK